MLSAIVIAVLLGIHMVVLHLDAVLGFFGVDAAEPTSWGSMIGRSGQGIWAGLYIALLAFALYHALYGLRGIILEVTTSPVTARVVSWVFIVVGIVAFIWGSYVPIALWSS
jgi:succinate dehydrogenase hydrophobic anchor subunit